MVSAAQQTLGVCAGREDAPAPLTHRRPPPSPPSLGPDSQMQLMVQPPGAAPGRWDVATPGTQVGAEDAATLTGGH